MKIVFENADSVVEKLLPGQFCTLRKVFYKYPSNSKKQSIIEKKINNLTKVAVDEWDWL